MERPVLTLALVNVGSSAGNEVKGSWVEPTVTTVDAGKVNIGALVYPEPRSATGAGPGAAACPTVVLMHGWADSAWSMDVVAQSMVETSRVVSLDLRGHGGSDRGSYNMLNLIGDLRGAIETLAVESPILIGHSLGGQVAAQFSGLYPEIPRALGLVEGVGPPPHRLADTDPDELERIQTTRNIERTRQPSRSRRLDGVNAAAARLRSAHPLLDPADAAFLAERNTVPTADGGVEWRFDPDTRDWLNGHNQTVAAQRWRGITCPVLVVNGADSHQRYWQFISEDPADYPAPLAGEALEERLSHFADVRYQEIAGAGHMLPYDKPEELNRVLGRFLSELIDS